MQIRQKDCADPALGRVPGVVALSFAESDQCAEMLRHDGLEVVLTVAGRFKNQVLLVPLEETLVRYGIHTKPFLCSGPALPNHVSVVLDTVSDGPTVQDGHGADALLEAAPAASGAASANGSSCSAPASRSRTCGK